MTGKNFVKGIHDVYLDNTSMTINKLLESNDWHGDTKVLMVIDMLEFVKEYATNHIENILSSSITLKDLRDRIIAFQMQITDFRYFELSSILDNIASNLYSTDEQTLIDVKSQIHTILKQYKAVLTKKITRMIFIRNSDVSICNILEEYLTKTQTLPHLNPENKLPHQTLPDMKIKINIHNLDDIPAIKFITQADNALTTNPITNSIINPITNPITNHFGYYVSGTETVMINSDLLVNYNINLKKMAKILKKKGLFNTYDPDEHSGINLKYYWNKANSNNDQGICKCTPHCSTKEKKSICNKITVLIFRPGSIVITGSRTLEQLYAAHKFTITLLMETMEFVRIDEKTDDTKQLALLNNEARKISRKPRLFYIKRENIRQIK